MKTIWKYLLQDEVNDIDIPVGAQILDVQVQYDIITMWVMVGTNSLKKKTRRRFRIYKTGQDIPDDPGEYIATVQYLGGFVAHVFEEEYRETPLKKDEPQNIMGGTTS